MRLFSALLIVAALVAAVQTVNAGDESSPWWDMANCDFCVNMSSQPGLMEAMQWESYPISNGSVAVVRTDESHMAAFKMGCEGMAATEKKAMAGEEVNACGMCSAMGQAIQAGAKVERVDTPTGSINIMTSDDPKVVAQLHNIVDRNQAEMKKMMEAESHGHDHGHSHGG